jgi:ribosomal protein S6--L-glutamate ligase
MQLPAQLATRVASPAVIHELASSAPRVAVLGRSDSDAARNIVEALDNRGARSELIDLATTVTRDGTVVRRAGGEPLPRFDVAIGYHGATIPPGGIGAMRALERGGVDVVNGAQAVTTSRDKWRAGAALQAAGIATPRTLLVRNGEQARQAVAELGMPVVMKLPIGTEGRGVARVSSERDLPALVDMFAALDRPVILQQMVHMDHPADVRAFVVGNRVIASMERRVTAAQGDEFRTNVSNGGSAAAYVLDPADANTAVAGARALGLDVAGMDLMGERGRMLIIEGNSGPGHHIRSVTGVDVADAIAELLLQRVS